MSDSLWVDAKQLRARAAAFQAIGDEGRVAEQGVVRVGPLEPGPDADAETPADAEAGVSVLEWGVALDGELAGNPAVLAEVLLRERRRRGASVVGEQTRAVYEATVREFGRALDRAGGRRARVCAQRSLIAEYLGGGVEYRGAGLARVVAGYRRWRDQLSEGSFDGGVFDAEAALADAFTDVMLNSDKASEPAKALCRLLTETAAGIRSPRGGEPG